MAVTQSIFGFGKSCGHCNASFRCSTGSLAWLLPAMVQYVVVFGCAVNSRVSELEDFFSAVTDAVFDRIVRIDVLGLPHRPNTPKCAQSNALQLVYNLYYSTIGGF